MSRIAVVTNATGTQGSAVVKALSQANYQVRALTRSSTKSHFQDLKNVTLVECNVQDIESVRKALDGAELVYAYTPGDNDKFMGFSKEESKFNDFEQGKRWADIAMEKGVKRFIWSGTNDVGARSAKYNLTAFREKAMVEKHIQELGLPTTFINLGMFMENLIKFQMIKKLGDSLEIAFYKPNMNDSVYPFVNIEADLGKAVLLLIDNFEKVQGKSIKIFDRLYSGHEFSQIITQVTKKQVKFVEAGYVVEGSEYATMFDFFADPEVSYFEHGDTTDENLKALGFKATSFQTFAEKQLVPFLGA